MARTTNAKNGHEHELSMTETMRITGYISDLTPKYWKTPLL